MPPWAWFLVVVGALSALGLVVDHRSRRIREGLVVPADRVGRGDRSDSAARNGPHSAGGLGTSGGTHGGFGGGDGGGGT
ncbi:hypothetical protein [Saccharothrix lopnurensis]|uniref:Uncharacterized protein n=1 Tax=Saccharothrix lopnurensis TaxID=1670621 RepID=A0ABW1NY50_9PSEU